MCASAIGFGFGSAAWVSASAPATGEATEEAAPHLVRVRVRVRARARVRVRVRVRVGVSVRVRVKVRVRVRVSAAPDRFPVVVRASLNRGVGKQAPGIGPLAITPGHRATGLGLGRRLLLQGLSHGVALRHLVRG